MWAKVWAIITGVLGWMWTNKGVAEYLILAIIIAFLTWRANGISQQNADLLAAKNKLPDNISFIATIKDTDFRVTYKDSKNNTVSKDYYIPREGGITFTKYIDLKNYDATAGFQAQALGANKPPIITNPVAVAISHIPLIGKFIEPNIANPKPGSDVIDVSQYGLTFRPGISAIYVGGLEPSTPIVIGVDSKLLYCYRWSGGIGTTQYFPYLWISRHIDDLVPFIKVDNVELLVDYGREYTDFGNGVVGIGARTNF